MVEKLHGPCRTDAGVLRFIGFRVSASVWQLHLGDFGSGTLKGFPVMPIPSKLHDPSTSRWSVGPGVLPFPSVLSGPKSAIPLRDAGHKGLSKVRQSPGSTHDRKLDLPAPLCIKSFGYWARLTYVGHVGVTLQQLSCLGTALALFQSTSPRSANALRTIRVQGSEFRA